MKVFSFIIILFSFFGHALLAQENVNLSDTITEVVITCTRKSVTPLRSPYSTATVDRKVIDQYQFRSVPEALMGTTGVFIQKTNHGGGSAFVRGLTGNQTLTLVDGIRLNNSTVRYGPNQYLNTIDPYSVSKIEVVRGSGSVQYGSDAMGGVVQILTTEPQFAEKASFHPSFAGKIVSQNMEYTGRAAIEYQSKKLAILVGSTNRKFGDLWGGDSTGRQSPSGYLENSFDAKIKYQVSSNGVLTAAHQNLIQRDVPLYHRVKLENFEYYNFDPQIRQLSFVKWESYHSKPLLQKITFTSSLQYTSETRKYHRINNANSFFEKDRVKTFGNTLDIYSRLSSKWSANSGLEIYNDRVNSLRNQISEQIGMETLQRGLYPDGAKVSNLSFYTLHHFQLNKLSIEAGLRYNHFGIHIPTSDTLTNSPENVQLNPSSLVSNLALLYQLNGNQSIYGSLSTGYRAPNVDDLGTLGLVDFRYEIPAYDLKPEKSYNSEIGYKYQSKRTSVNAALFYMHLTDLITRIKLENEQVGGYSVYTKENSQKSYIKGMEFSFSHKVTPKWLVQGTTSYCFGQNLSQNEPMRRIPPVNGNMRLSYLHKSWSFTGEYLFAAKQDRLAKGDTEDNRIPKGGTAAWNLFQFYGSYSLKKASLNFGIQNILNEDYRTHGSGINGQGRSGFIALNVRL